MMWWSRISYGGAHGPDDGLDDCLMTMVDPCGAHALDHMMEMAYRMP